MSKNPVIRIFIDSIKLGVFLEKLKLADVIPIFNSEKNEHLTNYRPTSVLLCFSKMLGRIMYNTFQLLKIRFPKNIGILHKARSQVQI